MATTTAQLTLSSADLTGDVLNLSVTATLTNAGTNTGMSQTTGIGRTTTTASAAVTLYAASAYADDKALKVYIRNTSSTAAEYITVAMGTATVGRLYAGDWAFIPWDGAADFKYTPSVTSTLTVEHSLFFEA